MDTTITTLREEIEEVISNDLYSWEKTGQILELIEKRIDERANSFLNVYDIDMIDLDSLAGRKIDEIPSQIAYLKALVDIKRILT